MNIERDRVISVSLTEAEWQSFVKRCPSPVDWLRARILDEVAESRREDVAQTDLTRKN